MRSIIPLRLFRNRPVKIYVRGLPFPICGEIEHDDFEKLIIVSPDLWVVVFKRHILAITTEADIDVRMEKEATA